MQENMPLVSIITICRNAMPYIKNCVDSILAQDYPHIEFIIQDGGSTDGTLELLACCGDAIKVVSQPDNGHGEAMNRALQRCTGQIIGTCNADDELMPHAVSWAIKEFNARPRTGAIYGAYQTINDHGVSRGATNPGPAGFNFSRVICVEDVIPMQSAFFRVESLKQSGLMDNDWLPAYCEDFVFWLKLGTCAVIESVPEPVSRYRVHEGSGSSQASLYERIYSCKRESLERFFLRPDVSYELKALRSRAMAGLAVSVANIFFLEFHDPQMGLAYLQYAADAHPGADYLRNAYARFMPALTVCMQKAVTLFQQKEYACALEYFELMGGVAPLIAGINYMRAVCLQKISKDADVTAVLQENLQLHPGHTDSQHLLDKIIRERGWPKYQRRRVVKRVPLRLSWGSSKPRIDLLLAGTPDGVFSWDQREGWARALMNMGMLNNVYWTRPQPAAVTQLFEDLRRSDADFVLLVCGDHHQYYLHDTKEKKSFWKILRKPSICHSIERVLASAFPDSETKTRSALETFSGFVYIDELSATLFESTGKPSLWIAQYADETVFRGEVPFAQRKNRVFFRGQTQSQSGGGVYQARKEILEKFIGDPRFAISEAYQNPLLTYAQAAKMKGEYRFVLNAPANCSGYSASLYEALACGCVVFQYRLPDIEVKSRRLFTNEVHYIEYDANDSKDLERKVQHALSHWRDYEAIASVGMQECLEKHTISKRLVEVIDFVQGYWGGPPVVTGASELDTIIPAEIKNDELYLLIRNIAREERLKNVLEIGSSSGAGSTTAFVAGLATNPSHPKLFCIEVSKERFKKLQNTYRKHRFVRCYNVSSVRTDRFLSEQEVRRFYSTTSTGLNRTPLDTVLGWLRQDIDYVDVSGAQDNGIARIKRENGIHTFDMVLIDGSAFTGKAELDEVYGARYILLDDTNDIKNCENMHRLMRDPSYSLVANNQELRNGYAVFKKKDMDCPVHFFTIVLNGEPFIRYHIEMMKQLPFHWHWHIIEGVAALKHDTAWSVALGGKVYPSLHRKGLSNDGTSEYLDLLQKEHPGNVTVYRKPKGAFWEGKREMVNAPLLNIADECLLWQIDVDELWTPQQIVKARNLFIENPSRTAAYYYCHYFVGEKLLSVTNNTYGNYKYEWVRTWRYRPGMQWRSHEPPSLCVKSWDKQWHDLTLQLPFTHEETKAQGLVFQHFAYAARTQLEFKEIYYGYAGAVASWRRLQKATSFPLLLRNYFPWVTDGALVDTADIQGIVPMAWRSRSGVWKFNMKAASQKCVLSRKEKPGILFVRTDSIGDTVLAAAMLEPLAKKFPGAPITVVCQSYIAEIYDVSPFVSRVIGFDRNQLFRDETYRASFLEKLRVREYAVALNSKYSRDALSDVIILGCGAKKKIAFNSDLRNIDREVRDRNNVRYTNIIDGCGGFTREIEWNQFFLRKIGAGEHALFPVMWLNRRDEEFSREFFSQHKLDPKKTIALFCGASQKERFYMHYGKALQRMCEKHGYRVIALGASSDTDITQKNIKCLGKAVIDICGKTSLCQSAALIKRCCLAVGAETGLAHIACAVGTANVVLIGGGDFGRFMPYTPLTTLVFLPLACYGCGWKCKYATTYCLQNASWQLLAEAVEFRLQTFNNGKKPHVFVQAQSVKCGLYDKINWKWVESWTWPQKLLMRDSVVVHFSGKAAVHPSNFALTQASTKMQVVQALDAGPDNLDALGRLFDILMKEKKWNAAGGVFAKIVRLHKTVYEQKTLSQSKIAQILNKLLSESRELMGQEKYDDIYEICQRVLEIDPKNLDALNQLAYSQIRLAHLSVAADILKRIANIDSQDTRLCANMEIFKFIVAFSKSMQQVESLINNGNYDQALPLLEKVNSQSSAVLDRLNRARIYNDMAVVFWKTNNREKARRMFLTAFQLDNQSQVIAVNYIIFLQLIGRKADARKVLQKYRAAKPDDKTIGSVVRKFMKMQ